ncbi:amidohydrolase family protein [Specibacter cremeus]|uniref:amidohydrolase family protein n=1 Tax=Specibacter cremeus TaxID=1629051 RepID=UPI0013DDF1B5|nr:amidohydrolase family protein [Specibacter cremeus]
MRNAEVFAPERLGATDVLLAGQTIAAIGDLSAAAALADVTTVDVSGRTLVPGLIDGHLHQIGGCGLQGYSSRAPELWAGELALAGITTSVATPGIETFTKNMDAVLAKAYALEQDGLSTYAFLGGFRKPFLTLTGSIRRDLYLIEKLIGIKVALGDAVASRFSNEELIDLAAELEWSSRATGKACIMHAHLGSLPDPAAQLLHTIKHAMAAPERFQATHGNNTEETLAAAVQLTKAGCVVDLNPLLDPLRGQVGSIGTRHAVPRLLAAGVELSMLTMSTDGNANTPVLQRDGSRGPYIKNLGTLWEGTVELVREADLKLEDALSLVTTNPARVLRLEERKGRIAVGLDADLLVLDDDLQIQDVYSKGRLLVHGRQPLVASMYEHHDDEY